MNYVETVDDKFTQNIFKALIGHFLLILFLYLLSLILGYSFFSDSNKNVKIEIIQSAVRVDLVAMPELTVQELKKIDLTETTIKDPEPEVKPEVKNETSEVEFKKVDKKVDLKNLLSNFSNKEIVKKDKSKKENKKSIDNEKLRKLILQGNIVSEGSSTVGTTASLGAEEFIRYIQGLPDIVRPNWKLPSYLIDQNLRCRIKVFVASNGRVIRVEVFESSGDKEFDAKAIEAVKLSSPFPIPSKEILVRVTSGQIILGFPL